jgi:hypothetical protein
MPRRLPRSAPFDPHSTIGKAYAQHHEVQEDFRERREQVRAAWRLATGEADAAHRALEDDPQNDGLYSAYQIAWQGLANVFSQECQVNPMMRQPYYTDSYRLVTPEVVRADLLLKHGFATGLEEGIRFLEADAWFFRSGYLKATFIRRITRFPLDDDQRSRLANVVLMVVNKADKRHEWKAYRRLARSVQSPWLIQELESRAAYNHHSPYPLNGEDVAQAAKWMLAACQQKGSTPQLLVAR